MSDEIVERIERQLGMTGLAGMLATRLSPTDLQSLLLAVARGRAAATSPASTRAQCRSTSSRGREVVEGGFVDWTQTLLGDRKERLLISGIGIDLLSQIVAP